MGSNRSEPHRQRAQELRALAHFIDDRQKQETLLWLARDYENLAGDGGAAGLAALVRQLHFVGIAEQLRG
jgi:hypothetical protein